MPSSFQRRKRLTCSGFVNSVFLQPPKLRILCEIPTVNLNMATDNWVPPLAPSERGSPNASTKQSLTDYGETGESKQRSQRT